MKMNFQHLPRPAVTLLALGLVATTALADPTPSPTPSAAPAATAEASAAKEFDATDISGLTPLIDQQVTITGTILSKSESKSGTVLFLHFGRDWKQSVSLVFFVKGGEPSQDQLLNYVGKKVRVTSKLVKYQEQLEFKLESPSVIEILP